MNQRVHSLFLVLELVAVALVAAACSGPRDQEEHEMTHGAYLEQRRLRPVPEERIRARLSQTTPADRRRRIEYVRAHPEIPRNIASMILCGEIETGMSELEVEASWGLDATLPGEGDELEIGMGGIRAWDATYAGLVLHFVRYGWLFHIREAADSGTAGRVAAIIPRDDS